MNTLPIIQPRGRLAIVVRDDPPKDGPATVEYGDSPKRNHLSFKPTVSQKTFIRNIQVPHWLFQQVDKEAAYWVTDYGPTAGGFQIELAYGRNVVSVISAPMGAKQPGGPFYQIESISIKNAPPDANLVNHFTAPHLVHRVTVENQKKVYIWPGGIRNLIMAPIWGDNAWIPASRLVFLDSFIGKTYLVSSPLGVNVRSSASAANNGNIIGGYIFGWPVKILKFVIGENGIWGQTKDGYIAVRFFDHGQLANKDCYPWKWFTTLGI